MCFTLLSLWVGDYSAARIRDGRNGGCIESQSLRLVTGFLVDLASSCPEDFLIFRKCDRMQPGRWVWLPDLDVCTPPSGHANGSRDLLNASTNRTRASKEGRIGIRKQPFWRKERDSG